MAKSNKSVRKKFIIDSRKFFLFLVIISFITFSFIILNQRLNKESSIGKNINSTLPTPLPTEYENALESYTIPSQEVQINFYGYIPTAMQSDVISAIENKPASIFQGNKVIDITSARLEGDWALISVGARDGDCYNPQYPYTGNCGLLMIATRTNDMWVATFPGTNEFVEIINNAPESFISSKSKRDLIQMSRELNPEN